MKAPISWLKDYVDIEVDAKGLAEQLTFAGIEVENIETDGAGETVLTLEITPNRPDLLGLLGIARDLAAVSGTKLKFPSIKPQEESRSVRNIASVAVEDAAGCPRYTARILDNIKVGESPEWMRRRLTLSGIGCINNVVDITNYVLLECGQPLHAFDLALLKGGKIIVRRAKDGESITTLDNIKRKLSRDMLVIADASHAVAIAGVMGGAETGVQAATASVLLESACFQPSLIRRASKTLELLSESSYRFERGVDINGVDFASRRACALMVEICGARLAEGVIDVFPAKPVERKIVCRYQRAANLLGVEISPERVKTIFNSLDLPVISEDETQCTVEVKTFRSDLEGEADLIEELARINGLDRIPVHDPFGRVIASVDDRPIRAAGRCRNLLASLGLREIMNYSFVSEKLLNLFESGGTGQCGNSVILNPDSSGGGMKDLRHTDTTAEIPRAARNDKNFADKQPGRHIVIPRPVSADHSLLRDSLLPQMVETLGRNLARQTEEAALFEIGRVFFRTDASAFMEETRTAIGLMGPVGRPALQKRAAVDESDLFFWLKGILRNFFDKLSAGPGQSKNIPVFGEISGEKPPEGFPVACFKANRSALISLEGKTCGIMGLLKDDLRREWRILGPVALMEITLEPFLKHAFRTPSASALPVYPSVNRDIAMRVPAGLRHEKIMETIRKNSPKELTAVALFDIYKGKEMGLGFKSMAYGLTYRSPDRTLADDEVNKLHEAVKKRLKDELKIEIREG